MGRVHDARGGVVGSAGNRAHDRRAVLDGSHAAHDLGLEAADVVAKVDRATGEEVVQDATHLGGVFEAALRILFERLHDDGFKIRIDVGVDGARRCGQFLDLLDCDAYGILAIEGSLPVAAS